jgi:hypothetical protein
MSRHMAPSDATLFAPQDRTLPVMLRRQAEQLANGRWRAPAPRA